MARKILFSSLCILLGAVFIFSGYTKLYPIEPFEYTFVDLGIVNWQLSPFVARLLIGLEFLIGILLVLNISLRFTYRLGIFILIVFCIYLLMLMYFTGNKGNCGCFGSFIVMTPLQALIKNIIMLAVFLVLYRYHAGWNLKGRLRYLILLPVISSFAFPFILNPVELSYAEAYLKTPEENFELPLDSLYHHATLNVPPKELSKGKHVLAFMSMTCQHCRVAANKMRIMHERNPGIPFYIVLNGEDKNLKPFFEATHAEDIPHCVLNGRNFVYLAGVQLPRIYLINNSVVEFDLDYFVMDQAEIEKWLKE
jgi:hypothetical protein